MGRSAPAPRSTAALEVLFDKQLQFRVFVGCLGALNSNIVVGPRNCNAGRNCDTDCVRMEGKRSSVCVQQHLNGIRKYPPSGAK
jgi:hypothetical protein